jgi:pyruvate dehydrogenase E1 component alpha subunit
MPSRVVDGLDVLDVYEGAKELVEGIRAGKGPAVLDCRTYRVRGHFEGDQAKYRDAAVTEEWKKKDCVARMERYLQEQGVLTAEGLAEIRQEVLAKMEAAIAFADASPEPTPEDLFKNLYV